MPGRSGPAVEISGGSAANTTELCEYKLLTERLSLPSVCLYDKVCIGNTDNLLRPAGGCGASTPATPRYLAKIVFGSRDFHLYCVDAQSGCQIWRVKADGRIISSPCIVGGKIWVGTATGYFYCFGA